MTVSRDPAEGEKRAAAEAAVVEVRDGMLVGIGTGTTAAYAISALGARVRGGLSITAIATSEASAQAAAAEGIRLLDPADVATVDLAIDGVDEIDPLFRAIKGAGGAMLREKIVANAAGRMIAIADASKAVARLGAKPVPLEVLPLARAFVAAAVRPLGADPVVRRNADGAPVRTDQGNIILDCRFVTLDDSVALAARLSAIPGLLGHGLFLSEIDALYLGTPDGVVRRERQADV
ncbi:MAG: ribose-5-phosphate isomerase RpiA [Sphingomonadaceae bacterium]|nr:ribose-5-phosphate isomerase RpiA [Sphingomonadaceae bacterium]